MRQDAAKSAENTENRGVRNKENIKTEKMIDEAVDRNDSRLNKDFRVKEKKEEEERLAMEKKKEEDRARRDAKIEAEAAVLREKSLNDKKSKKEEDKAEV